MPSAATTQMTTSPVVRLIEALRSPLPPGFEWGFRYSDTCALQVAEDMGIDLDEVAEVIGEDFASRDHPLCAKQKDGLVPLYGVPARDVTPLMVADALERLVAAES